MKSFLLLISIFISLASLGQCTKVTYLAEINFSKDPDKENKIRNYYYGVDTNRIKNFCIYFRYKVWGQQVEIYSKDSTSFLGMITTVLPASFDLNQPNYDHYYRFNEVIDSQRSRQILLNILKSIQFILPKDNRIFNFEDRPIDDCQSDKLELYHNSSWVVKDYYCIEAQKDSIPEINNTKLNIAMLDSLLNLSNIEERLSDNFPKYQRIQLNAIGASVYIWK